MWLLPLLFLFSILLNGALITKFIFKPTIAMIFLATSFVLGSILSTVVIFLLTIVFNFAQNPILLALIVYFIVDIFVLFVKRSNFTKIQLKFEINEVLFMVALSLFFSYIFFRSFSYDSVKSQILISSNTYLDFGAHLPIIRSFSLGHTVSLTLPFFAGQTLVYHFLFDFLTGIFEFLGARIDWAYNIVSLLSFLSLTIFVFSLTIYVFKNYTAALISIALLLFNGTLTFILFLQKNAVDYDLIGKIRNYNVYLDNGPFGSNLISIFWNLNTYLNQRHFIFAQAFFFCLVYRLISEKINPKRLPLVFLGVLIGLFPLWHMEVFLMSVIFVFGMVIVYQKKELLFTLSSAVLLAAPQLLIVKLTSDNQISLNFGFLLFKNFNLISFANYWIWNLGFYIPTIIISYFLLNKSAKKLFFIAFIFFLLPNIFQFTPEMFNNHKFFNVWIIFMAIFVSYLPVFLWRKNNLLKITAVIVVCLLTLSGLLSFFVIKNDVYAKISDYKSNNFLVWIVNYTRPYDTFLTNGDIYDPVTIAGRKTFLGREHFVWAYGVNPDLRLHEENEMLKCVNKNKCLSLLKKNRISYVAIYTSKANIEVKKNLINTNFFEKNFKKVYESDKETVYKI